MKWLSRSCSSSLGTEPPSPPFPPLEPRRFEDLCWLRIHSGSVFATVGIRGAEEVAELEEELEEEEEEELEEELEEEDGESIGESFSPLPSFSRCSIVR